MIGERLIQLRGKRTQKQIAEQLGISRSRYSHYETNHVQPSNELLQKMSDFYGVTTDFLLGRKENEFSKQERAFLREMSAIPLDTLIQKYPLKFMGEQIDLTKEDKLAIVAFIKTLLDLKNKG